MSLPTLNKSLLWGLVSISVKLDSWESINSPQTPFQLRESQTQSDKVTIHRAEISLAQTALYGLTNPLQCSTTKEPNTPFQRRHPCHWFLFQTCLQTFNIYWAKTQEVLKRLSKNIRDKRFPRICQSRGNIFSTIYHIYLVVLRAYIKLPHKWNV